MLNLLANVVRSSVAANPALLSQIGRRLGNTSMSLDGVLKTIRNNKLTSALVAMEIGETASEVLEWIFDDDPDVKASVEGLMRKNDPAPEASTPLSDLAKYTDEFVAIKSATSLLGGLDNLLALRRAIAMDDGVLELYVQLKGMRI